MNLHKHTLHLLVKEWSNSSTQDQETRDEQETEEQTQEARQVSKGHTTQIPRRKRSKHDQQRHGPTARRLETSRGKYIDLGRETGEEKPCSRPKTRRHIEHHTPPKKRVKDRMLSSRLGDVRRRGAGTIPTLTGKQDRTTHTSQPREVETTLYSWLGDARRMKKQQHEGREPTQKHHQHNSKQTGPLCFLQSTTPPGREIKQDEGLWRSNTGMAGV